MCNSHSNSSAPFTQVPQGFLLSEPEPLPILWASASCFCRSWSSFGYDNPCSSFLRSPLKKDCHFRLLSSPKPSLLLLNQSLLFFWKFFLLVLLGFSDVFIVCDRLCSCFCINSVSGICNLCLLILQNSSVFRYSCSVLLSHLVRITEVLVSWAVQTSLLFFIFLLGFFFLKYIFFRPNFSSRFSSSASILLSFQTIFSVEDFHLVLSVTLQTPQSAVLNSVQNSVYPQRLHSLDVSGLSSCLYFEGSQSLCVDRLCACPYNSSLSSCCLI